ncbi:hypothetical protein J3E61_006669 [Mycobacterium sp. OAE908]
MIQSRSRGYFLAPTHLDHHGSPNDVSSGTIRTYICGRRAGYCVGRLIEVDIKKLDALVVTIYNS